MKTIKRKDGFSGERSYVLPAACVARLRRQPLSAILHITDIGYYPDARGHYRERLEPLSEYVFIYCTRGSGWYEIAGRRYEVNEDSYFILPPGMPHRYGSDPDGSWTIYWIHFAGSLASEYMPASSGPVEIRPGVLSRIADRLEIFEEIMGTLQSGFGIENLLYACSVFHHFLGTLRYVTQYRSASAHGIGGYDMAQEAIHYMRENLGKKLHLAEIAEYVGYSQSQFSVIFRKAQGMPPMEFLNRMRVEKAARMLKETNLPVNTVCHNVGISDPYYFSRLFKAVTGRPPSSSR